MYRKITITLFLLFLAPQVFANTVSLIYEEEKSDQYKNFGLKYTMGSFCDNNFCFDFSGSMNMTRIVDFSYPNAYLHFNFNFFPDSTISPFAEIGVDGGELLLAMVLPDENGEPSALSPTIDVNISYGFNMKLSQTLSISTYYKSASLSGTIIQDKQYDTYGLSISFHSP